MQKNCWLVVGCDGTGHLTIKDGSEVLQNVDGKLGAPHQFPSLSRCKFGSPKAVDTSCVETGLKA